MNSKKEGDTTHKVHNFPTNTLTKKVQKMPIPWEKADPTVRKSHAATILTTVAVVAAEAVVVLVLRVLVPLMTMMTADVTVAVEATTGRRDTVVEADLQAEAVAQAAAQVALQAEADRSLQVADLVHIKTDVAVRVNPNRPVELVEPMIAEINAPRATWNNALAPAIPQPPMPQPQCRQL